MNMRSSRGTTWPGKSNCGSERIPELVNNLDHVGLPVRPGDLSDVADRLVRIFGATRISRQEGTRPAAWLSLGDVEIHLIAHDSASLVPIGKTFSPHLCVCVDDLSRFAKDLDELGLLTWYAGTLSSRDQLWVLLAPSFVVEAQSVPPRSG